ncbi:prepilin peptidase [Streptomyces alkaliterrae]|uniref:Prepilin peptidase n=1 Tax=Streptomyces alkaliterrae TaxID=2213162 RepID=A0A5P0YYA2_9ACTN|nr:prepilin peptidase [Streptomyces alkaliterrae]MBB1260933.1 prepilin peptidase [Streptomyces alkaliterrae]MQS05268.1 prepilin peptidase [Streptomyces alkaliterrae]
MPALALAAAGYGALIGLLLPRAAYQLAVDPDEPWHTHCPRRHPLPNRLGLARCTACEPHRFLGALYGPPALPFVLLTGATCALLALTTGARPELLVWLLAAPPLVLLCWVDGQVRRLPDLLTLPLATAVPALLGAAALLPASAGDWPRAVLGGTTLCLAYFVLFLLHPAGVAFGDVKLAMPVGTILGWHSWTTLFLGALAGLLSAALYATLLLIRGRVHLGSTLAFGPHLVLGTLVATVLAA